MSNAQLPGVFGDLAPVLDHYGYLAVGGLILLEDFGIPAPGETVLIAAALYAGAGKLNILLVVLIAFVGAVIGDNIGLAIGSYGGRRLVLRWGRYVFINEERLQKAEGFFGRHGGKVVVVARFIEGLRQVNGIVAGISEMRWRHFAVYNAIGAALWVGAWSSVGYFGRERRRLRRMGVVLRPQRDQRRDCQCSHDSEPSEQDHAGADRDWHILALLGPGVVGVTAAHRTPFAP